ncbi:MAG: hypothetical protein ACKN92_09760 [Candidatus Nanopelagicaceae bacterium]
MPIAGYVPPRDIKRLREILATSYLWNGCQVVMVSSQLSEYQNPPSLLSVQFKASRETRKYSLDESIEQSRRNAPIDVVGFRHQLPSDLGNLFTKHLLEVQKIYLKPKATVVEDTARRYLDLISWGEPNSAKVLAEEGDIPLRTIHSRLMNARKKGLLDSPGIGFRF